MEGGQVTVVAISHFKPESLEALKPIGDKLIEATRKEEGNLKYDWYADVKEKGVAIAVEKFKSMEAFQAHITSEHIKEAVTHFKEASAAPTVVRVLKPENEWAESKDGTENSISIVAIFKMKPESIEEARVKAEKLMEHTRKEPGCQRYDWYQDVKEPGVIVVIQHYADNEACQAHINSEHLKVFREQTKDWLLGEPEVHVLIPRQKL